MDGGFLGGGFDGARSRASDTLDGLASGQTLIDEVTGDEGPGASESGATVNGDGATLVELVVEDGDEALDETHVGSGHIGQGEMMMLEAEGAQEDLVGSVEGEGDDGVDALAAETAKLSGTGHVGGYETTRDDEIEFRDCSLSEGRGRRGETTRVPMHDNGRGRAMQQGERRRGHKCEGTSP